jgi:hypothetical protein
LFTKHFKDFNPFTAANGCEVVFEFGVLVGILMSGVAVNGHTDRAARVQAVKAGTRLVEMNKSALGVGDARRMVLAGR